MGTPVSGGGCRHGQNAVLGLHRGAADVDGRAGAVVDAEKVEGEAGAHDIGDGTAAPTSWKWTFLEQYRRILRRARREGGLLDDLGNVRLLAIHCRVSKTESDGPQNQRLA
jgi:hypothetical protein